MNFLITLTEIERLQKALEKAAAVISEYSDNHMVDCKVAKPIEDAKIERELSSVAVMVKTLRPAYGYSTEKKEIPTDKILVDRNEWESVVQEISKYRREDIEEGN
jgi:hypothetical protein